MRLQIFAPAALVMLAAASSLVLSQSQPQGAPELFTANAQTTSTSGASAAATVTIDIRRYTPDAARTAVETALKGGGYPAFLTALRKAPEVGTSAWVRRNGPFDGRANSRLLVAGPSSWLPINRCSFSAARA